MTKQVVQKQWNGLKANKMKLFSNNYKRKSDEELMQMLLQKEQSAFEELYDRYSKPMLNFFFRNLHFDKAKAEDLLHDLFIKLIEKPQLFDTEKKFSSWLYALATNMLKNEFKKQQRISEHVEFQTIVSKNISENPEQSMDKSEFDQCLEMELTKLDSEQKILFSLRFQEEKSIKEIAEIMEIPEGTVKSRLFYLVKKLSQQLIVFKTA